MRQVCAIALVCLAFSASTIAQDPNDWLTRVNLYRAAATLPPAVNSAVFSDGDYKHARYIVKTDTLTHGEDAASPWYTPEGAAAAANSDLAASYSSAATDASMIDLWMQGPFHAIGILDPRLATVGFGIYHEADGGIETGAGLDVIRGRAGTVPAGVTFPVAWPGNGSSVPLTSFSGGETPDPLASCAGYARPTGLPIILQLGTGAVTPSVTASSFSLNGGAALAHCLFTETTYTNPDGSQQSTGRSILGTRNAIVLIPRAPLVTGSTYHVSITTNGFTVSWNFTVNPFAAGCSYSVAPASVSEPAAGGTGAVSVTTTSGCAWTATSNDSWITVQSGGTGSGNATFSVAANTSTTSRTGTATVAGKTVTFTQAGAPATCTYSLSATGGLYSAAGGPGSVGVTTTSGCAWTAIPNASWISVTSGASGSGSRAVGYTVQANASTASRASSLTIAGQTYSVSQDGVVIGGGGSFSDDFTRPDSTVLGNSWSEVLGDLEIKNNELTNALTNGYKIALAPLNGAVVSGAADFAFTQHQGVPRFGIVLRYQNPTNYYLAYRQSGGSSVLRISKFVNGVETILKAATLANPAKDAFFRIEGSANGSTLTLKLNGVVKVTVTDTTYASGSVGVLIGSTLAHIHRADDFIGSAQ